MNLMIQPNQICLIVKLNDNRPELLPDSNEIMNAFERYRAWNEALYHYYFNNNDQQVLLYVDDDVLEEVGKGSPSITKDLNGKKYFEHFLSSTCIKRSDRVYFPKTKNDRDDYPLLYKLMERMSRIPNIDDKICMCLPFAVMLLYLFQKGDNTGKRTEQAVKAHIMSYLGQNESFSFSVVEKLWAAIEKNGGDNFESSQLAENTSQPYVGRLKFHLVLKKRYKDDFLMVLKDNNLVWDEQRETFSDFINFRVWPYLTTSLIDAIRVPIHDLAKRPYFESLVRSCHSYGDSDYFSLSTERARKLVYVYSWQENNGGIDERLWFKIDEPRGRFLASFHGAFVFIDEDNTDSVLENVPFGKNRITVNQDGKNLEFEIEDYPFILFKEVRQGFFEQEHAPKNGENYIFIYNDQKALDLVTKQDCIDLSDFIQAFGISSKALYIRNWVYDSSWENHDQSDNYGHLKQQYPRWVGGLLSPNNFKKRSYTYSALPFIEFETEELARLSQIEWRVANSDESSWKIVSKSKTIGNRRYINKDIDFNDDCSFLHIELRVVTANSITPLSDMFVSRKLSIEYTNNYRYDKYGVCTDSDEDLPESSIINNTRHKQAYSDEPTNDFNILDIFTQYSGDNGVLSQEKLKNALRYIFKYYDIRDEKENRNALIRALIDLGYINGYQDPKNGLYYNQLNKPFLSRTQKSFIPGGANIYTLRGCYDSMLVRKLTDYSRSSDIKIGYISLSQDKPLCCLPDIIVVDISRLKNYNEIREVCGIPVIHNPQAYSIIENLANFKESCAHFLGTNAIYQTSDINNVLCPLITHEGNSVYLNISNGDDVLKSNMYRILEYSRKTIPIEFMYSYVQNMRGNPAVILEPNSLNSDHLELSSFLAIGFTSIMGTNESLIRALCELSLGLPKVEKAFIVNASQIKISDISSHPLYSVYRSYEISANNEVSSRLVEKLVHNPTKNWSTHPNVLITNRRINNNYKVFLSTNKDIGEDIFSETRMYLQFKGVLEAFCIRRLNKNHKYEYITCVNFNETWRRFLSGTVNEVFSDIILETTDLLSRYQTIQYSGTIPTYMEKQKDGQTIPYYDNIAVEQLKIISKY